MPAPTAALRSRFLSVLAAAGLAGCLTFAAHQPARATTGPTNYLPLSPFHVPDKIMPLYRGQYILAHAASRARLSGGELAIEINPYGYLYGIGQFYGYDVHGHQTAWTATLYNFRLAEHGTMVVDLLGPGGTVLDGRLYVVRAPNGNLAGQIELRSQRYAITWRKFTTL
jgi:hypothetical protein